MKALRSDRWLLKQLEVVRAFHLSAHDLEKAGDRKGAINLSKIANSFYDRAMRLAIEPRFKCLNPH